ncbi:Rieske (2Fe-2S) protein [Mesorhizobium sp. M1A.F.Ca.IN.020.06.1.1]|uniref:Rieske (2Fe-2S) protein n=1 Tax=unclassified Mesorhizobium TaxID=325217 RepID=UPI000FCC2D0C|nr:MULTISPECIES: Rieske (2Fe-2S) protein [unclassified Mesorhizobium]RUV81353.1 Rieske (2Fe-2S) protein [Mesorhizobium sp. M1A.F.Ca.IN.020.32.1.1]RUW05518.1 Rieske (2Fe-2S) protein [Mesorhizobium sp. M1A.F.Ca.IN.022.05.2.1]RUW17211.1 Rieske (2Fe-2S) protein [Mesorhizobium sp. M1A.F.Ca.IN.020.06.1.1]RWF85002.1 MAG: Rieske (2Fe-2S) protein [Mesorhizobium sp.]RWG07055.1 MAG: Rieske (2Fe-2S) protein [Mesorhizobium sp.]
MSRHVVATVDEIEPGKCKIVTVKGRQIGVFRIKDEFFALINRCPHQGAALCEGDLVGRVESPGPGEYKLARQGEMVRCPWHGWEFDIRTGQSWCDPDSVRARTFAVEVEPGEVLAKGPFQAETVAVNVDGNYVVITV